MAGEYKVSHEHIEGGEETKTSDPAKLRMMVENIDAKIDALKAKRERIIRQLYELEGDGRWASKEMDVEQLVDLHKKSKNASSNWGVEFILFCIYGCWSWCTISTSNICFVLLFNWKL